MIQKREDQIGSKSIQAEVHHGSGKLLGGEGEEQFERITITEYRVRTDVPLGRQVIVEKVVDVAAEAIIGCH
jgi:hypothetical protein